MVTFSDHLEGSSRLEDENWTTCAVQSQLDRCHIRDHPMCHPCHGTVMSLCLNAALQSGHADGFRRKSSSYRSPGLGRFENPFSPLSCRTPPLSYLSSKDGSSALQVFTQFVASQVLMVRIHWTRK